MSDSDKPPLVIVLKWMGALSPNRGRRMAAMARSGNEKSDREYGKTVTDQTLSEYISRYGGLPEFCSPDDADKIYVHLFFEYPTNSGWDVRNAASALKATLDGICDALGVNDSRFVCMEDFGQPVKGGRVTVTLGRRFGWVHR